MLSWHLFEVPNRVRDRLSDGYRNEIALLPVLRDFYDQVACINSAIIFILA